MSTSTRLVGYDVVSCICLRLEASHTTQAPKIITIQHEFTDWLLQGFRIPQREHFLNLDVLTFSSFCYFLNTS